MAYLIFATVWITVKSIQAQLETSSFTFATLFTNALFRTLILSMVSTYLLYFTASFLFLDPWRWLMTTQVNSSFKCSPLLAISCKRIYQRGPPK